MPAAKWGEVSVSGDRQGQICRVSREGSCTYFPDGSITDPDDIKERRHDLGQELHAFEPQGLEDEGDGLNYHGVVVREGLVPEDTHQGHHGHSWVELIQRQVSHVDQHFAGAVVS